MSHKFTKNNCISDSESDEENSDVDSLISSDENDSDVSDSNTSKNTPSQSVPSSKSANYDVSSSDKENSLDDINEVFSSSSTLEKHKTLNQKNIKDLKGNKFKKRISGQSMLESSFNSDNSDTANLSPLESSISVVNETKSVIEDSGSEILNSSPKQTCDNPTTNKIVEESSDSEASVELVDSFQIENWKIESQVHHNQSVISIKEKSKINSSLEIEVIESPTSKNSIQSLSKNDLSNSACISQSEISNESHNSVHSNSSTDERRILERQLADKRTAYQNIWKAVKSCDPKKLKDGGKLLQEKLLQCKDEVDELREKIKALGDIPDDNPLEKNSTKSDFLLSINCPMPANLGKKGMETHRVESALTVDALVTLHGSLQTCPAEDALEKDPKGLRVELMPHQKYALAWLLWREQQTPPGGILADDMGLGKTLTIIALILRSEEYKKQKEIKEDTVSLVDKNRIYPGRTLVICPSSLLGQWQGQIKQHCKTNLLSSLIHHGKPRELQAKRLAAHDIVITSYGVVVEENKFIKDNKKGPLFRVKWERVVIDEGHVIRNHKTKSAQAVCELEAKYRWCLTGTPVQNKELDMYSLLKFLRCAPFDNLAVWKRWVDNKSANGVRRLNTVVKSILLRRTKEELKTLGDLVELPTKNVVPVYIKLDEEEQKVYHTVLQFSKTLLAEFILQEQKKLGYVGEELRSEHHQLLNSANEIKTAEIFVLLLRLRQICCLPGLIHSMLEKDSCIGDGIDPNDDPILQDLTSHMKRVSIGPLKHEADDFEKKKKILVESNPVFKIDRPSAKIRKVLHLINEALDADDKIVIVSQWANLLQKIKAHIIPLKIGLAILDGSVPVKLRPKIIDEFNRKDSSTKVMLLSLTAGGVGLNLVGGNRLVIFEPHWNPQLESQACDRVYRVGQKKEVFIYKIICKETIEERIEELQKKKLEIANTVLKGELKMNRSKLTLADLKILFDIHN